MDELTTWADVARRVDAAPRGTITKLAAALRKHREHVSRKLKDRKGDLTVHEQRAVREFFGDIPPQGVAEQLSAFGHGLEVYGRVVQDHPDRFYLDAPNVIDRMELPMGLALGPGEYFVVLPPDSRMEPRAFAGETHVVRRDFPATRGKKAVIEFRDGTGTLKTYMGERDGRVFAEQYNPHQMVDWNATEVKAIHPVAFSL